MSIECSKFHQKDRVRNSFIIVDKWLQDDVTRNTAKGKVNRHLIAHTYRNWLDEIRRYYETGTTGVRER
tara:strand:+ start:79 stop:285 length:207 start_codon:yes stop_codon:yes gene_type:complete